MSGMKDADAGAGGLCVCAFVREHSTPDHGDAAQLRIQQARYLIILGKFTLGLARSI